MQVHVVIRHEHAMRLPPVLPQRSYCTADCLCRLLRPFTLWLRGQSTRRPESASSRCRVPSSASRSWHAMISTAVQSGRTPATAGCSRAVASICPTMRCVATYASVRYVRPKERREEFGVFGASGSRRTFVLMAASHAVATIGTFSSTAIPTPSRSISGWERAASANGSLRKATAFFH